METGAGTLLGGQVVYHQPRTGYRSGIEPVLLAAAIPARAGERVLEGGTGAGAALLCVAARVPGIAGTGVEQDPALAALARRNAAANGFTALDFAAADLLQGAVGPPFHHAMANPPWHLAGATASVDAMRDAAKRGRLGLIGEWAGALGRHLRHRGTLTLIVPARCVGETLAAMEAAACGTVALLPLWPHAGCEARVVLVQGRRGGRAGTSVLPGLVLHEPGGPFTAAAEAILRDGAALPL